MPSIAKYSSPDRLADVLALLQTLALVEEARWSEEELLSDLGAPRSASTWTRVCEQHPEFFRVRQKDRDDPHSAAQHKHRLSLLARVMLPADRRELSVDFVAALMKTAIDLH